MPSMTKDPVASTPPGPQMVTPTSHSLPHRPDVVVDLAVERRRRRRGPRPGPDPAWFCPQRYRAFRSAAIAELSNRLGSLEAAWHQLDAERATAKALAEARRAAVVEGVARVSWSVEQQRRYAAWRATPVEAPELVTGERWPEPYGPDPGPYDCDACEALFGPAAWGWPEPDEVALWA